MGVKSVDYLRLHDGELNVTMEVKKFVVKKIRTYRPNLIITWDPAQHLDEYYHYLQHSDHRASGQISLECAYPMARDYLFFPEFEKEGIYPWNVGQVYMFSTRFNTEFPDSNIVVDISKTINRKLKSLFIHKSQIGDPIETEKMILNMGAKLGRPFNVKYAEWFQRVIFPL